MPPSSFAIPNTMTVPTEDAIPLHTQLRASRRRAGWTQAALATRAGCMQSAISMMESGRMDALARPTLEKIAELLGVPLAPEPGPGGRVETLPRAGTRFCPNPECPSNFPYVVGSDVLFRPRACDAEGAHCPLCGEVLTSECPACATPAAPLAACCTHCGQPLVAAPPALSPSMAAWVADHQRQAHAVAAWGLGPS